MWSQVISSPLPTSPHLSSFLKKNNLIVFPGKYPIRLQTDERFCPIVEDLKNLLATDDSIAMIIINSPNNPSGNPLFFFLFVLYVVSFPFIMFLFIIFNTAHVLYSRGCVSPLVDCKLGGRHWPTPSHRGPLWWGVPYSLLRWQCFHKYPLCSLFHFFIFLYSIYFPWFSC